MNRSLISMVVMGLLAIGLLEFGRRSLDQAARRKKALPELFEAVELAVGGRCEQECRIQRREVDGRDLVAVEVFPFGAFDPERFAAQVVDALEKVRDPEAPEPEYRVVLTVPESPSLSFGSAPPWLPGRRFDRRPEATTPARPEPSPVDAGAGGNSAPRAPVVQDPSPGLPATPPGR